MPTAALSPEPPDLRARVLSYLDAHTTLNLATAGPAGVWAAAVLYVHEGTRLYFTSVASTRHGQNMLATGTVAGTINADCTEWTNMRGIQLEGKVERVDDLDERRRIVRAYLERFPFGVGLWHGESDVENIARDPKGHDFYRITPSRVLYMDNEQVPPGRQELKEA